MDQGQPYALANCNRSSLPTFAVADRPSLLQADLEVLQQLGYHGIGSNDPGMLRTLPPRLVPGIVETDAINRYCWSSTKAAK